MGRILSLEELPVWREEMRIAGKKVVVTNGVFDLMHRGHAEYLAKAASFGDVLLVLLNDDASVRELKGPTRPIVSEQDRAVMVAALGCVAAVAIFHGERCTEALRLASPDVYAKGGDYTIDTLNRQEYGALQECHARIELLHFVQGCSTTNIVKKILSGGQSLPPETPADFFMKARLDTRVKEILSRRSIRRYRPQAIENRDLAAILEAAMAAPSACGCYPAEFLLLTEPSELTALSQALPNGKFLPNAAACIIVCGDIETAYDHQLSYLIQDCAAAIENILLAATRIGLGSCWLGIHPRQPRIDAIRRQFKLPENVIPVGGIALGWPDEHKDPRTQYSPQKIHLNQW